jgi:hypothetical protein
MLAPPFKRSRSLIGLRRANAIGLASFVSLFSACGPGVATPMPEPPTVFELEAIEPPSAEVSSAELGVPFRVAANALPLGATFQVTNLDSAAPPSATRTATGGVLEARVVVDPGVRQELRFEWILGAERSRPIDATYFSGQLEPSLRFDCIELDPGFVVPFPDEGGASLHVRNGCDAASALADPRLRRPTTDITLGSALPMELLAGESTELVLQRSGARQAFDENQLFFQVTLAGRSVRYPVSLVYRGEP